VVSAFRSKSHSHSSYYGSSGGRGLEVADGAGTEAVLQEKYLQHKISTETDMEIINEKQLRAYR